MKLPKTTETSHIDIWAPKYSSNSILIAAFKVRTHNRITFSKTPSMPGDYYLSGDTIKKYPTQSNGRITCYAVHRDELEALEYDEA